MWQNLQRALRDSRSCKVIYATCSRPNAHAVPLATFNRVRSEDKKRSAQPEEAPECPLIGFKVRATAASRSRGESMRHTSSMWLPLPAYPLPSSGTSVPAETASNVAAIMRTFSNIFRRAALWDRMAPSEFGVNSLFSRIVHYELRIISTER